MFSAIAIAIQKIPRKIPHTNLTPPDRSDRLHPPHNPSVVGSIPTGPTIETKGCGVLRGSEPEERLTENSHRFGNLAR